jgi:hypothetical protein
MKTKIAVVIVAFVLLLAALPRGAAQRADNSSFVGDWNGEMYGVKAVTLDIREEKGELKGSVLFYLIRHNDGKPPRSSPGTPEPLIGPHFDGKALLFKVSHRNAHPPQTLNDPPVSFRLELLKPNLARLTREGGGDEPTCELTREQ